MLCSKHKKIEKDRRVSGFFNFVYGRWIVHITHVLCLRESLHFRSAKFNKRNVPDGHILFDLVISSVGIIRLNYYPVSVFQNPPPNYSENVCGEIIC